MPLEGRRNIVVLMDGTSNQIDHRHTNVLRLFRVCAKNSEQLAFYHPGVGTVARDSAWQSFRQKTASLAGLAFGYGLDENVVEAYAYLVEHWRPGDRVFLFGFSRGAWTVRVLAGLIHTVGLMRPGELHLVDHALGAYKRGAAKRELPYAWRFGRVVGSVRMPIWFLGCFDTVASVIVPRPDRAYVPSLEELPYTHENPSVLHFRHALAIDERRRMFRPASWDPGQTYRPYLAEHSKSAPQDVDEMWFTGVHGDVGGGYPEADSALAKIPLAWMLEEAEAKGLKVMRGRVNRLVLGRRHRRSVEPTVAPDPLADMHESLTTGWWPLELLPRRASRAETHPAKRGLYLPRGERRAIPSTASVHPSVRARVAGRADYDPPNLT